LPEALFRRVFFAALLVLGAYIVAGAFDGYSQAYAKCRHLEVVL
jgi:hypothetical protein